MPAIEPHQRQLHELYSSHHGWLYQLLRRKVGNAVDAADLAQDAFMRLLAKPRDFDSATGARAYLSTVARGLAIDMWRRQELERAWLEVLAAQPEAVEPSTEHRAMILEALYQVDAMLRRLPVKTADAFVLAMVYGMTDQEIAIELGVSDRMVRKHTAKAMLHCMLLETSLDAEQPARNHRPTS